MNRMVAWIAESRPTSVRRLLHGRRSRARAPSHGGSSVRARDSSESAWVAAPYLIRPAAAATARHFAGQGAWVFLAYYRAPCPNAPAALRHALETGVCGDMLYRAFQQQPAEPLVEELRARGARVAAYEVDLGHRGNIAVLSERCEGALDPVEILVNNHTHCVLETFDPGLVSSGEGGAECETGGPVSPGGDALSEWL